MTRRRMSRVLAVAGLAAALALGGCGGPRGLYWPVIPPDTPAPRLVDESANGGSVTLQRTQWLLVRLPLTAGDAFRWTWEATGDDNVYPSAITPRYETDRAGVRNEILTFRAEGPGTAHLRFSYRNLESPQLPAARIVAFDVVAH
jgi:hypothetical protein